MKNFTISLSRNEIFDEVALSSAYRGARGLTDISQLGRVSLREGDRRIAAILFDEGVGNLTGTMRPFLNGIVNSDTTLEIRLSLSADWPEERMTPLQRSLKNYLKYFLLGKWMEIIGNQDAEKNILSARGYLTEISGILYSRNPPKRPTRPRDSITL